jgi:hypothetical protein
MLRAFGAILSVSLGLLLAPTAGAAGVGGTLTIEVVDRETKQPLACRMHLTNAAGKSLKAPRVPYWHDHFVFDGTLALKLPKGQYEFVIERGLEYRTQTGHFTLENFSKDTKVIELERFADLAAEGWWSGDLDTARPAVDLELLMRAEDLHVVELITWPGREVLLPKKSIGGDPLVQFDINRFFHQSAGIDARGGGTLLLFNLKEPLDLGELQPEFPPQQEIIGQAKSQDGAWVDAQKVYGWDVPLWVAGGQLDSIQVLNSNLRRAGTVDHERGGKPRDELLYPGASGNGRWSETIYYHLLNCGLRIPPTAGSGSGEVPNPLGYNRMYVHVDGELTYDKWWEGVRAGRVVITNGPLLRPTVEGELPGFVFRADSGQEVELEVGLTLSTRDRISYVDVIKNGELEEQVRVDDLVQSGGRLSPIVFRESGWLLLRATAEVPGTYRYAMSAPYYVEIGEQPRISKASAQFFLDWVDERAAKVKVADPQQRAAVLKYHEQAKAYWQDLVDRANAP